MYHILLLFLLQVGIAIATIRLAVKMGKKVHIAMCIASVFIAPVIWISLIDLFLEDLIRQQWIRMILACFVSVYLFLAQGGLMGAVIGRPHGLVYPVVFWLFLPVVSIVGNLWAKSYRPRE